MPKASLSEIYLVVGLMLLFVVISIVSLYLFIRQYKREKAESVKREKEKTSTEE